MLPLYPHSERRPGHGPRRHQHHQFRSAVAGLRNGKPFNKTERGVLLALMAGTFVGWRSKKRPLQSLCGFLLVSFLTVVPFSGWGLSETPFVTPLKFSQKTVTANSAATASQQTVTVRLAATSQ